MGGKSQEARYLQQERQQTDSVRRSKQAPPASPPSKSSYIPLGSPPPCMPPRTATGSSRGQLGHSCLPAEAPICQKGTISELSRTTRPHDWQRAARRPTHTQVTRHACVHTDTHAPTSGWERQVRDSRSEHRVCSHAAPDPVAGKHYPAIPRGTWRSRERPWDGKGDVARGSGWDPAPPSGGPQSRDHRGSRYASPAGSPSDRSTYPAILPLPLGSFARGTTRAFSPLPCRWREESCLFLCPAPGPSPASPAWPRAVGSPRSRRCLRPSAPLGLPAAAAEPRSTWRAAGRGRDGGGDRDAGDRPFTVPAAPRAAPRLRSRAASPAPGSSLAAEPGRQRAKPRRTAKVSGRRLAAAPRMVSAGGEGRRAVRSAQRPAGIPRRTRGTGDRRLSAPAHRPIPFRDSDGTCRPPGPGAQRAVLRQGRGLPGGPRRRRKRRRAAGPALRAASEIPRSAGSSKHLRACLWH